MREKRLLVNFLSVVAVIYTFTNIAQQIEVGYNIYVGAVAHRSEQAAHNHLVDSSTLSSPTKNLYQQKGSLRVLF